MDNHVVGKFSEVVEASSTLAHTQVATIAAAVPVMQPAALLHHAVTGGGVAAAITSMQGTQDSAVLC